VRRVRRLLLGLTALVAFLTWLWIAATRAAPGVRERKAAARAARLARSDGQP
jgi:hypothetical protein